MVSEVLNYKESYVRHARNMVLPELCWALALHVDEFNGR